MGLTGDVETLRYLSICSGIEAATVAWHPLGWQA
jgi:DNA (cytosine-5)-methyltransferase 1